MIRTILDDKLKNSDFLRKILILFYDTNINQQKCFILWAKLRPLYKKNHPYITTLTLILFFSKLNSRPLYKCVPIINYKNGQHKY